MSRELTKYERQMPPAEMAAVVLWLHTHSLWRVLRTWRSAKRFPPKVVERAVLIVGKARAK